MKHYFIYRLYKISQKSNFSDLPIYMVSIYLGILVLMNLISVNLFLFKINGIPFMFKYRLFNLSVMILVILGLYKYITYIGIEKIVLKYSYISKRNEIIGNTLLIGYIVLTFFIVFYVAYI